METTGTTSLGAQAPTRRPRAELSRPHLLPASWAQTSDAERRPLWDAVSGRFDPGRLRAAIVARRWTVADFVVASSASRSTVYKALRGYAVGDRSVVRILATLEQRTASGLLDD